MRRHRPSDRVAIAAVAVVGGLVVLWLSIRLFPYHSLNHDEAVYLQQAAMLLEGQLAMSPPVEDVFRPWFFVVDGDRLYPKYTPVPAAMFALGELLGEPRIALGAIAAGNLALAAGVVARVFDRRTGLLAAAFVLCSPLFLLDSAVFLPYAPTTLLNLAFAYAYFRAEDADSPRWAAIAGGAIGLAFFARPYTAVLFAAPFIAHAGWTLAAHWPAPAARRIATAVLGLAWVGVALAYNAVMTGSALVFPYQAFAPLDGLGFGRREILAHEVVYTPELAVRANAKVLDLLLTEWVAGGVFGSVLALAGLALAFRRRPRTRPAIIAGIGLAVALGNVYFWGNFNILGDIDRTGDGLVSVLGPYYHFDLLLPTGAFAAHGTLVGLRALRSRLRGRLDPRSVRAVLAAALLVVAGLLGTVTAGDLDRRVEANMDATETYETAYEPFAGGPPANSLVLLPDPYGDWLNHPFQPLRNDPDFDGRAVYAIDDRPFAVADAFPDRTLYRYVYRGAWAPYAGSPDAARLQRVRDVTGDAVLLAATVGVPEGAVGVTARVSTDAGSVYYVAPTVSDALDIEVRLSPSRVRLAGDVRPVDNDTLALAGPDTVRLTVFVDYGAGGGFSYRFDLPVEVADGRVRALSPRVERCRDPRACGGSAAYVPEAAPEGVFVRTELTVIERNQ